MSTGHPKRLMEYLVNVNRFALETERPGNRQDLFDQRPYSFDAVDNKTAVLLGPRVGRKHRSHQFGRTFDSGQRVPDFMSKAG